MSKKKDNNGVSKAARIITLIILIAGLLLTFGAGYGSLAIRLNMTEKVAIQADDKSDQNEKIIISMQGDLKYIIKAVDEVRGK